MADKFQSVIRGKVIPSTFATMLINRPTILGDKVTDEEFKRFRTIGLVVLGAAMGAAIGVVIVGL